MTTQFEFRLIGAEAPAGELDAAHLSAILNSLQAVATSISRRETDAEATGRPPKRTQDVARLLVSLAPGSTRVLARRAGVVGTLPVDLAEEEAFDARFAELIESVGADQRPAWVSDPLSRATAGLVAALQQAAPQVEFLAAEKARCAFATSQVRRETWAAISVEDEDVVTFTGRLLAVNLHTHRLSVYDDVGHQVALPFVQDDRAAGHFLGGYVTVVGRAERDSQGRLTHLHEAHVTAAPALPDGVGRLGTVGLDEILASAPGPDPDGGIEMSDDEWAAFMDAVRGG